MTRAWLDEKKVREKLEKRRKNKDSELIAVLNSFCILKASLVPAIYGRIK